MAALIEKQIERGTVNFGATDITITVTLGTTLTNTSKTMLLFDVSSVSANAKDYLVAGYVKSTTEIEFRRDAAISTACTVKYQVIEYTQGIEVQHIAPYALTAATSFNITITTVDLSKSFAIMTLKSGGNRMEGTDYAVAEITSTTNLQIRKTITVSSGTICAQVIQIDDASVQAFVTTYGTGATKDITVTTIDSAKTFWVFSIEQNVDPITADALPYLSYTNSTTLRFTRASATSVDWNIVLYVVSLSAGVAVQNISTVIASSGTTVSPTISPAIVVNNTALLISGTYQRFASVNSNTDDGGYFCLSLDGLTTTAFTATRSDAVALAATTNVQVLSWIGNVYCFLPIQDNL